VIFTGSSRVRSPGFAEAGGGRFISVADLPGHTVRNIAVFMGKLRGMHEDDPLAFEVCMRHVASMIEDQRREEGRTDPRKTPPLRLGSPGTIRRPHAAAPQRARQRSPVAQISADLAALRNLDTRARVKPKTMSLP
jgi:hypothetical protein